MKEKKSSKVLNKHCHLMRVLSNFFPKKKISNVFEAYNVETIENPLYSILLKDITGETKEIATIAYGYLEGNFVNEYVACECLTECEYLPRYCFLGEHLLSSSIKPVGIVNRFVSAIIMSLINPEVTWLATGEGYEYLCDCDELWERTLEILKDRQVTFFPCLGQYDDAVNIANTLKNRGLNIDVDTLFRDDRDELRYIFPQGTDIADYILDRKFQDLHLDSMI